MMLAIKLSRWLSLFVCALVALSVAEEVTISDGATLRKYLCPSSGTLPSNTHLVLSKSPIVVHSSGVQDDASEFCLIENTTDISIGPSQNLLSQGANITCVDALIGFGFFNVTNLAISSVVFHRCSAYVTPEVVKYVNETDQFLYYNEDGLFVSLYFSHCYNLKLHNTSTGFISTYVMIGVNLCGDSEIINLIPGVERAKRLMPMFLYFTNSAVSPAPQCNLNVTTNIITSFGVDITYMFDGNPENVPVFPYDDFVLFLAQPFVVNVDLNIGQNNISQTSGVPAGTWPVLTNVVFVNSDTTSHVSFQGLELPYQLCRNTNSSVPSQATDLRPLKLAVIFYETPGFVSNVNDTLYPMEIRNTAFTQKQHPYDSEFMLSIIKLSGTLSHQVSLNNVSWCYNTLAYSSSFSLLTFRAANLGKETQSQSAQKATGELFLGLNNIMMHHNLDTDGFQQKTFKCLMCFSYIKEITLTGHNYFAQNAGGTVLKMEASDLRISGNLTIMDGHAYQGGGIYLDGVSTLFLGEPLLAGFYNNIADEGSAIYSPVEPYDRARASHVQVWPAKNITLGNVGSINISIYFGGNRNGALQQSFYAPLFSLFGNQLSPNLSFSADTWVSDQSQYAYTILFDTILHMDSNDKFASLSNGFCVQLRQEEDWKCSYFDQLFLNYSTQDLSQCKAPVLYTERIYPGQIAFSVRRVQNQLYDIGDCYSVYGHNGRVFKHDSYTSMLGDNSTVSYRLQSFPSSNNSIDYHIVSLTNIEVGLFSLPILKFNMTSDCPLGFCINNDNGSCTCNKGLASHGYSCDIDSEGFTSQRGYWTGQEVMQYDDNSTRMLFDNHCHPKYCNKTKHVYHLADDPAEACLGNHTGVLCGECKENYSVVFGSDTCCNKCTDAYLLTLLVYILAGPFLVFLLFALRITVATGTINGLIFYANVLGLVLEKLTDDRGEENTYYVEFVRVFFSLLNLDLGFPLCFFKGMTTAHKVGLQFLFPVYLWSIVIILILLSKYSIKLSEAIPKSSVRVLATLFYLSFSKVLNTVIIIITPSTVWMIDQGCSSGLSSKQVWYYDGHDYGNSAHAILLAIAIAFTVLFLVPYALFLACSSCLLRYGVVNRFLKPFVDAYGGPFKDKWRFWFGLRLWITIILFGVNGALEGTNSDVMFVMFAIVIMTFVILQSLVRPFKNYFIGVLDLLFMVNYWLLISAVFWMKGIFWWIYILTSASAVLATT